MCMLVDLSSNLPRDGGLLDQDWVFINVYPHFLTAKFEREKQQAKEQEGKRGR